MTMLALRIALVLVGLGVFLLVYALGGRRKRGLGSGETVSLDDQTLYSERYGLVGRPDRLVSKRGVVVPEEWKASKRVSDGHRLQLGTYFILIEEKYGVRPPHGVVVLGDGSRVVVKNTDKLRSQVLAIAQQIREHRRAIREEISVRQPAAKCRVCGQSPNCGQSRS